MARSVCEQLIEQFALAQLSLSISDAHTEPADAYRDTPVGDVLDDLDAIDHQFGMSRIPIIVSARDSSLTANCKNHFEQQTISDARLALFTFDL